MAQQGATLQNYNNELVKCIETLREKREEINRVILKEEEEKAKIQVTAPFVCERTICDAYSYICLRRGT